MNNTPTFSHRTIDGETIAVIEYADGSMFTTGDWQSTQPQTPAEVESFSWYKVDASNPTDTDLWQPAIMLHGWPRTF
jgi:hypothetical protein